MRTINLKTTFSVLLTFVLLCFGTGTYADDKYSQKRGDKKLDLSSFADQAGLDDDQRNYLMNVMETARETRKLMREEGMKNKKEARTAHREDVKEALAEVLTTEQVEAFQVFMKETRGNKAMHKKQCKDKRST